MQTIGATERELELLNLCREWEKQPASEFQTRVSAALSGAAEKLQVMRLALEQYARIDYYLFLLDPVGQKTDPTKKAKEALQFMEPTKKE